jgi:hypothetical protein
MAVRQCSLRSLIPDPDGTIVQQTDGLVKVWIGVKSSDVFGARWTSLCRWILNIELNYKKLMFGCYLFIF